MSTDNDYERGSWWWLWLITAAVITWTIIIYAIIGIYFRFGHVCPTVKAEKSYLADRRTVARHKYHGIHTSVYNPATGEAWFVRDGRKCQL